MCFTQPKLEMIVSSPFAVGPRARDGLDLEVEAPSLLFVFLLGGGLAVKGAGGTQFGQALVLVRHDDLERENTVDFPY